MILLFLSLLAMCTASTKHCHSQAPDRPCPPGADANASYDALKQWVMDKIPTGARTAAVLVSGAANAVAFGNLSQAEFNEISTQITFHPNNFAWVAAIPGKRIVLRVGSFR